MIIHTKVILILTAGALAACTTQTPPAPDVQNNNVAVARQLYVYFNDHDWKSMAALYSDSADFKDPSFGQMSVKQNHMETIEKYTALQQTTPDIHDDIEAIYPSGDHHVIVEFTSSGTAPDGTKWLLPLCTVFTISEGKITRDNTYYDLQ